MTDTTGGGEAVPVDAILSVLADERRRSVLRALSRTDGDGIRLDTLVDRVMEDVRPGVPPGEEREGRVDEERGDRVDEDRRDRVGLVLRHTDLPKLNACGMIDYDAETRRVRGAGDALIRDLMAVVDSHETRDR